MGSNRELWDRDQPCEHDGHSGAWWNGDLNVWTCRICPGGRKVVLREVVHMDFNEPVWVEVEDE